MGVIDNATFRMCQNCGFETEHLLGSIQELPKSSVRKQVLFCQVCSQASLN